MGKFAIASLMKAELPKNSILCIILGFLHKNCAWTRQRDVWLPNFCLWKPDSPAM